MSGRSSLEARAREAARKAREKVKSISDAIRGGDPNDAADQLGGLSGQARDIIRGRQRSLDEQIDRDSN